MGLMHCGLCQVGATTLKEHRKYFEKDAALERRFQPVLVAEPSTLDALDILKGLQVPHSSRSSPPHFPS